jgi:hypothetical protein
MSTANHDADFETPHLTDDLNQISKWARDVLFKTCKFLYRGKSDLDPDCFVFAEFESTCLDNLKGPRCFGENVTKQAYVQLLWNKATDSSLVQAALTTKRSAVYTLMQNRFMGK